MLSLKNPPPADHSPVASGSGHVASESRGDATVDSPEPFEASCVRLIDRLAAILAVATESRKQERFGEAAAAGKQMLLSVLDFAEENLEGEALGAVQERVADAYEQCKQVDDLVATRSWRAVRRVLGKTTAAREEVAAAHGGLGEAIAVVVITAVAGGGDRIEPGSPLATQMAHSLKSFIDNLRTDW